MEAVTILRELWRRRILVGALAIVCVLVAFSLTYTLSFPPESRKYEVAIANGRILVDTPDSQVVDVRPRGSDTLGVRANLFANLMTEGKVKSLIAEEAGLRPGELQAGVESEEGTLPASLASSLGDPDAYALTTRIQTNLDGVLPIVELETQAPNAKEAVTLASAAVVGLQKYLASKAATEDVPDARRLRVIGLGTPQVREAVRGPQRLVAFGIAVFLFLVGCAAIILVPAIARSWRAAAARERAAAGGPLGQGVLDFSVEDEAAEAPARPSLRDLWNKFVRAHPAGPPAVPAWRPKSRSTPLKQGSTPPDQRTTAPKQGATPPDQRTTRPKPGTTPSKPRTTRSKLRPAPPRPRDGSAEPGSTGPEPRPAPPEPRSTRVAAGANGDNGHGKPSIEGDGAHGEASANGDGEAARSDSPAVRSGS